MYRVHTNQLVFIIMSEDVTTPGTESHQLQAPWLGFNCTGIIEQTNEHTSAKHVNTMATISNTMENQLQQMNKIIDILAGISQFLVKGNLGQNTPNNGVPPSTCQQQTLGQTTPERVLPLDRNYNDQDQPTDQTGDIKGVPISRFSRFFSRFFGCFSGFLVKFLPIFKVLLKIPPECLSQSTGSENFQKNIKIRRFSDKNWVIPHNVIFISTRTNKTKC